MSVINSVKKASRKAVDSSEEYLVATQDYLELKAFQQLTWSFALLAKVLLIGGLCFLALVFLIVAGIITWANYLDSTSLALLYSSLVVFGISLTLYFLRKPLIESPIIKKVSQTFFS